MSTRADRVALGLFAVSALALAFLAGGALVYMHLPPYQLLARAKAAADSVLKIEDDALMTALTRLDPDAPAAPEVRRLAPGAGSEPLLLTGGFWQDMAECPRFGCLARIIDRDGRTLHRWEVDPAAIAATEGDFAGRFTADNIYPIGLALVDGGDLIVTFHARNSFPYQAGIARISRAGEVLWVELDHSHHWIDALPDGTSFAPVARVIDTPHRIPGTSIFPQCHDGKTLDEGVRVRDGAGKVLRDYWMTDVLLASNLPGLLYSHRDGCDPFHVNSVERVSAEVAATLPGVTAGDLLISAREPGLVAVIGAADGVIKQFAIGRTAAQHGPQFLPDGTVAVFDNRSADMRDGGGTRIERIDFRANSAATLYPRDAATATIPLLSEDGGHVAVSPDGTRVMISSKDQSRSFEVDVASGAPLWQIDIAYDIQPFLDAHGLRAETSRGRFNAYGIYYLTESQTAFLRN